MRSAPTSVSSTLQPLARRPRWALRDASAPAVGATLSSWGRAPGGGSGRPLRVDGAGGSVAPGRGVVRGGLGGCVFRDQRVELVEGEVWPVSIGRWHGSVAGNVTRLLPDDEWRMTNASLPAAGSITDPDVWVHRRGAQPVSRLGATGRLPPWRAGGVALVVEVADATFGADTEVKAGIYGRSGFGA